MTASRPASRTSGSSASNQDKLPACSITVERPIVCGVDSRATALLHGTEEAHPPELRELALMGVEHEVTGVAERRFDDRPLTLTEHYGVGLLRRRQRRASPEDVEEHPVQVQAVDQIELGDVDQVDADETADRHTNRIVHVRVGHRVHGVDLVVCVEIGVERVHHHDQFVGRRTGAARIDNERPVKSLVNVPLQRNGVAMIEVQSERIRVELVDEALTRLNLVLRQRTVHRRLVPAMKMKGVRVRAEVLERDLQAIPFGGANGRPRYLAVERPRGEEQPGSNLNVAVDGVKLVLPEHRAVGTRGFAVERRTVLVQTVGEVPAPKEGRGIEGVSRYSPDGSQQVRMAVGGYMGSMVRALAGQP